MTIIANTNIAIIIPALNEQATIEKVVRTSFTIGIPIVIDDGSKDSTASIAHSAGAYVFSNDSNLGYEASLNFGLQQAINLGFEFALTMDADGQHSIESSKLLIQIISNNFDIVIGCRKTKQRIIESLAGIIGQLLWKIDDPFSGLKLYRLSSFDKSKEFNKFNLVGCEIMMHAIVNRLKICTVTIETLPRIDTPRFGNSFKANLKLMRALFISILIYFNIINL